MEEGGATALGPSLCVAVGMCESSPGSEILLCTGLLLAWLSLVCLVWFSCL